MAYRFHQAAQDGLLDHLKEATRKDCNAKDDDGMTPTLWAAFHGNLDALRLLVGRGGDPEKCDHYGNTGLHFAAARGHMNCVTFLVNYGVNLYAKDIDGHTAKDLAAMNDRQDILSFLDEQAARLERSQPKKVKSLKEKADKDADKLAKEFAHVQEKARKMAEKEKKRLEKERAKMERSGGAVQQPPEPEPDGLILPRPSIVALRKDSRLVYEKSPKFSDLVSHKEEKDKIKLPVSGVYKKVQQQRMKILSRQEQSATSVPNTGPAHNNNEADGDFKVGAIEDGKRSVRSISGLRRDSEVMYVPKYDDQQGRKSLPAGNRMMMMGGAPSQTDSGYGGDDDRPYIQHRSSIFERPGFGGLAFRNSIAGLTSDNKSDRTDGGHVPVSQWDNDDEIESDDDDEEEDDKTPMHFFLCAVGLEEFVEVFVRDKFDLDSLMLVKEADLVEMKIPRGHRLKLMRAIADRKAALENPPPDDDDDELEGSHL